LDLELAILTVYTSSCLAMKQRKGSDSSRALLGILLIALIIVGDIVSGAIGSSAPSPVSGACSSKNGLCGPIQFDQSIATNSSSSQTSLTSAKFTVSVNETIIIITHSSLSSGNVTTITDSLGNSYTFRIKEGTSLSEGWLEIWTAKSVTSGTDAVTVTWNIQDFVAFMIDSYKNVADVRSFVGTTNQLALTASLTTTVTVPVSGSWVFGAGGSNNVGNPNPLCPTLSLGSNFVQRGMPICGGPPSSGQPTIMTGDNATALPNNLDVSFTFSNSGTVTALDTVEFILLPIDTEPFLIPLNVANMGPLSGNLLRNIVVGTTYCTGQTTLKLTTLTSHKLQLTATYAGQSRNDTGAVMRVDILVGPNAPSTTFASGNCATGGTTVATGKIYFATSGATLTAFGLNEYAVTVSGVTFSTQITGTYYGWVQITPQSVGAGNLGSTIQYAQWGANGHISITLSENGA
jgi:hypothetical protein